MNQALLQAEKSFCSNVLHGGKMNLSNEQQRFEKVYGTDPAIVSAQKERYTKLIDAYSARFGTPSDKLRLFSSPGRTEIGGNHTDHNLGKVLAASINLDCIGAVEATEDNTVHIYDITYNEDYSVAVDQSERIPGETGSIALVRGMIQGFKEKGYAAGGFKACFTSDVISSAGVSSSASFEMMICTIMNFIYNEGKLPVSMLAAIGQFAENKYWDKASGLLDQTACATGGMATIDFADPVNPATRKISFDFAASGYSMMIVNTGKGHADLSAEYSSIPAEMKSVAKFFGQETLRGLSFEQVAEKAVQVRAACGDRALMRAFHFFEENDRVDAEVAALESGDFAGFLRALTDSGNSSWKWLQNICVPTASDEQPIAVCLAATEHFIRKHSGPGAKPCGCRVHGGGFAGVIQAFIPDELVAEYTEMMEKLLGYDKSSGKRSPVYKMGIRSAGSVEV